MSENINKFTKSNYFGFTVLVVIIAGLVIATNMTSNQPDQKALASGVSEKVCNISNLSDCTLDQLKTVKEEIEKQKATNQKLSVDLQAEKEKADLNVKNLDAQLQKIEETKNKKW